MTNKLSTEPMRKAAKSDKRNRGELSSIRITPAENGYTVTCAYEPAKPGPNQVWPDDEVMVFGSAAEAGKYVASMLGEHESYEAKEK